MPKFSITTVTKANQLTRARRNAAQLNLEFSSLVAILRQTVTELFDSVGWIPFTHFYGVFNYILQPNGIR